MRTQLGLGPAMPATQLREPLEEQYGIKTFVLRSRSKLSGACVHHQKLGGCILVIARPLPHMLFTLAHELAHLLVHRDTPFFDEDLFAKTPREQFANAFAAGLLMPRVGVHEIFFSFYRSRSDLVPADIVHLARHFGTSYGAMLWRLQGLRLIVPALREALAQALHTSAEAEKRPSDAPPNASSNAPPGWPALPERYLFLAVRACQHR